MRYFIQIIAMLGDLIVIGVCAFLIYSDPWNPIFWFIIYLTFKAWNSTGGFIAWTPSGIRAFMTNAKKLGL
jgi:hypothetical protein